MTAEQILDRYRPAVEHRLDELLPSDSIAPVELHRAMRYSCLSPGKRLRPAMLLSAFAAISDDEIRPSAVDAACAVEMVHCFSLIHDDLPAIDNDDLRRGRPTCHKVFGDAMAILAGDALFALAFQVMASPSPDVSPEARVIAIGELARSSGSDGLVGGEVADVLAEGKPYGLAEIEWIHTRKTGALFAASAKIGALYAGADLATAARFSEYGLNVGLAFQIADDVLNEVATAEQLGKAAGSDRERGKATFPAAIGAAKSLVEAERHLQVGKEALGEHLSRELQILGEFALGRRL